MNSISQKNLELFSKLSGDFNPLHLDQEFAKNSYYGDQVIYGIYQVFLTLENFFKKNQKNIKIQKIKASFILSLINILRCRRRGRGRCLGARHLLKIKETAGSHTVTWM
ncbi:hypothetical protein A0N88_02050, partial [Campylobacter jejuni]|uniref:MaoC/PaaZ C-terminal domain-containing protein n=1 Tax=Campylobacter jejuni TaxID=197 RepID=UPI00091C726A